MTMRATASTILFLVAACSTAPASPTAPGPDAGFTAQTPQVVKDRPYDLLVPESYDAAKAAPLVILLHGYGASAQVQEAYFKFSPLAASEGFLYAMPNGTPDKDGNKFWDATDACCDFSGRAVDDVAYVNGIIDDVQQRFHLDTKRVYVVGHSNGGFMAHRLACDLSPRIAAVASLAGAQVKDVSKCAPSEPVAVLQVHGDADTVVLYGGGPALTFTGSAAYPGAVETTEDWAMLNACDATPVKNPEQLDLDAVIFGTETTMERYLNCKPGGAAELWTIRGGGHVPGLTDAFAERVWAFFKAHPKP